MRTFKLQPVHEQLQNADMTSSHQVLHDAEEYDLESFENFFLGLPTRHRARMKPTKPTTAGSRKPARARRRYGPDNPITMVDSLKPSGIVNSPVEEFVLDECPLSPLHLKDLPKEQKSLPRTHGRRSRLHQGALRTVSILDTLAELAMGTADRQPARRSLPPDLDILAATAPRHPRAWDRPRSLENLLSGPEEKKELSPADLGFGTTLSSKNGRSDTTVPGTLTIREKKSKEKVKSPRHRENDIMQETMSKPSPARHLPFSRGRTPDWIRAVFDLVKRGKTDSLLQTLKEMDAILIRNLSDRHGNNLFHACALSGQVECLHILLQQGKACEEALQDENKHGFTPVVLAIKRGHLNLVKWLVERTAVHDRLLPSDGSWPLVHWAAKYGKEEILQWLLTFMGKETLDATTADSEGNTPLHIAARYGFAPCIKALAVQQHDLTVQNSLGHKPSDTAQMFGHVACAEYLMALEACTLLSSDVSSSEQEIHSIKTESLELRNHFREVLSCAKKLLKEREELSSELNKLQSQTVQLNDQLLQDLQVVVRENDNLREKRNGGKKNDIIHEHLEATANLRDNLHLKWQEEKKRWSSGSWLSELESRLVVAEDKWRRARSRIGRSVDPCRPATTIFSERLRQVRCRSADVKFGESKNLSTSESSLSSIDLSEESEADNPVPGTDVLYSAWNGSSGAECKTEVNRTKVQNRVSHNRTKCHRSRLTSSSEEVCLNSLPQITKSQTKSSPSLMKLSAAIFGEIYSNKPALALPDFSTGSEQTCSVLEVIEPVSEETNSEKAVCVTVSNKEAISELSLPSTSKLLSDDIKDLQAKPRKETFDSLNLQSATDKLSDDICERQGTVNEECNSEQRGEILEAGGQETVFSLRPRQNQNQKGVSLKNEEIEESVEMMQEELEDIKACAGTLMSPEPDLIKETKGIRSRDETVPVPRDTPPPSDYSEATPSGSGQNSIRGDSEDSTDVSLLHHSRASEGLPLDGVLLPSSPSKRKGFLQKFNLRWPSKRKSGTIKPSAKKSQEISAEDFRETYMRSINGENGEVPDLSNHGILLENLTESSSEVKLIARMDAAVEENDEGKEDAEDDDEDLEENDAEAFQVPPPLPSSDPTTSGQTSILTLSDLSSRRDERSVLSLGFTRTEESGEPVPRPASSASKSENSHPECSASRMDFSALKAGFPLRKVSSISTDLLPGSSTVSRMSPAPSEVSKTESALLSPSSDVSRTESVLQLRQLGRIEEIVNRENKPVLRRPHSQVKQATILDISNGKQGNAATENQEISSSPEAKSAGDQPGMTPVRKRRQDEKPWYDLSDDEDMLMPERLQRTRLHMRGSSDDEEAVLDSG